MQSEATTTIDLPIAVRVGRLWRLAVQGLCGDVIPAGSPERSLARVVAATSDGARIVIERLPPEVARRKMEIAATIDALSRAGLSYTNPYLRSSSGQHVLPLGAHFWQVSPFLEGAPLPRPAWVWDGWRGESLAHFLVDLRRAAQSLRLPSGAPFSVSAFCSDLLLRIRANRPGLAGSVAAIIEPLLGGWLPADGALEASFCHGDPHPLNVIWSPAGESLRAVIDWEFCGLRPAAYDTALIIGCVGIEEPDALTGPLVREFLQMLRELGHPAASEPALWALVLAIRLAWLSDWLRRGDEEMVALEQRYLTLLVDRRGMLEAAWGCG
ncbi:MAG: phosphotransferase [Chloroflexi bacterium]|nr:phosphotransferase [Chloroflexota bacterium]